MLSVMDDRHVVAVYIRWSSDGDTHHAKLVSNALQRSMPNFMAANSAPKTDDSIVDCFYESQLISNMFKKIRIPVHERCANFSPAW
jgi:hypothetical protein